MHVDAQRIYRCHQHIQAQVEFVAVYQERAIDVSAHRTERESGIEVNEALKIQLIQTLNWIKIGMSSLYKVSDRIITAENSLLHYQRFSFGDLCPSVDYFDAGASGRRWWLDDPFGVLLLVPRPDALESLQVLRQDVRVRHKIELLLPVMQHLGLQVAPNAVLAADLEAARNMVHLLERPQRSEARTLHVFAPHADPIVGF